MPEIKHTFMGGKMNKDLDERLIPKDGYVDAMNIQISTSEESNVGTAQNILGNKEVPVQFSSQINMTGAITIASIADEKNDKLYYFIYTSEVDYIFEYSTLDSISTPVFVDINKDTLKFHPKNLITGINIIDGMLFWTDNRSEPKKINIARSKQGTVNALNQTKLVNDSQSLSAVSSQIEEVKEEHITIIKKAPRKPLDMRVRTSRDPKKIYTGIITIARETNQSDSSFSGSNPIWDFSSITTEEQDTNATAASPGDTFALEIVNAIDTLGTPNPIGPINSNTGLTGWHSNTSTGQNAIAIGTKVVLAPFDDDDSVPGLPLTDYVLKGVVVDADPNSGATTYVDGVKIKILSINGFPPPVPTDESMWRWVIDLWDEEEKLFEFKFPRFSYRYKYEDGEYSSFAPFTQVAFSPGSFDYHPRKGYNLGMTNRASSIELTRIVTKETPKDVVSIDILFKDEPSPNIYIVDTISPNDFAHSGDKNYWNSIKGNWESGVESLPYIISKETIKSVVPSNQLLRPWDNVPRKALAQDVTGNRIVYGNYVQNYNLKTLNGKKYTPSFAVSWANFLGENLYDDGLETVTFETVKTETFKSIKSLREYQLGVVFTDKYGRETPVISNNLAVLKLEKERADKANRLKVGLKNIANRPVDLTHMKFYVKETAGEYYNMAMDRWYDAKDNNVWLAFPSSDRNKVDIDTFLILKKGSDQDTLVSDVGRYKVLAIENEAPDFIKTSKILAASVIHSSTATDLFTASGAEIPIIGRSEFKMLYSHWAGGPGRNLDNVTDAELYVEFKVASQTSDRYRISSISSDFLSDTNGSNSATAFYSVQIDGDFGDDVNFITNDPTGVNSTSIKDGVTVNIYKYKIENTPKFDGRFFVKIYLNDTFTSNIGKSFIEGLDYRILDSKKVYSMKNFDDHVKLHWEDTGKFLSVGRGIKAKDFVATGGVNNLAFDWLWDYQASVPNYYFGYYAVDEFASMATYFRKYHDTYYKDISMGYWEPTVEIKHLKPSGNIANAEKVYKGEGWEPEMDGDAVGASNTPSGASGSAYSNQWPLSEPYKDGYGYSTNTATSSQVPGAQGSYIRFQEKRFVDGDNPIDTDVWFIDAGPAVAHRNWSDTLDWGWLAPHPLSPLNTIYGSTGWEGITVEGHQNQQGLVTTSEFWNFQLSYGGIKGSEDSNLTEDFFNFGDWNTQVGSSQNPYYTTNNKNTSFVANIQPGKRFRWREDPTGRIYTLGANIDRKNLLRHSARRGDWVDTNYLGNGCGGVSMAEDLSFNFTSGFNLRNITPALGWNPYHEGKIPGGYELTLTITNTSGTTSGGNVVTSTSSGANTTLFIWVNTLTGTDANTGDTIVLQEGMALAEYTKVDGTTAALTTNITASGGVASNEFLVVTEITKHTNPSRYQLTLGGYSKPTTDTELQLKTSTTDIAPKPGGDYKFVQVGMNGYSHNSEFNINTSPLLGNIGAVGYHLDFVEEIEPEEILSDNPAIFETEPKEIKDLDIYYEASPTIPMQLDRFNIHEAIPIGSKIAVSTGGSQMSFSFLLVVDYTSNGELILASGGVGSSSVTTAQMSQLTTGTTKKIIRPDKLIFDCTIDDSYIISAGTPLLDRAVVSINPNLYTSEFELSWFNCYSFQNGVESNRIRDNFNLPYISNGVRVSTTLETEYKEEHRKYGLIYSGLYNSTGGINNLNQFIQAEKITKDINPIYGSIQKLHSRDSDLVTLCEDKILKILANKDAVFNADGNTNLTATENVLGQTIPFSGEFGISTNPESFASENYRAYFSDKVRGAVLRLSKDGLTPISDAGMKDWFRDNLKISNTLFGSYDDKKDEYNLTLSNKIITETGGPTTPSSVFDSAPQIPTQTLYGQSEGPAQLFLPPGVSLPTSITSYTPEPIKYTTSIMQDYIATVSFKEDVRGWVSFKSFLPEHAVSMANDYYTFKEGKLWKHHDETVDRNTFYGDHTSSSIDVVLNDDPSSIKTFHTLNYEGSQSKINKFTGPNEYPLINGELDLPYQPLTIYSDQEYYNLTEKEGWHVDKVFTDKEEGYINEFIEKEGKWFNNINKLVDVNLRKADTADFTFQGIGEASNVTTAFGYGINLTPDSSAAPDQTSVIPGSIVTPIINVFAPGSPDPTAPQMQAPVTVETDIETPDQVIGVIVDEPPIIDEEEKQKKEEVFIKEDIEKKAEEAEKEGFETAKDIIDKKVSGGGSYYID